MVFLKRRLIETFLTEIFISLFFAALINIDIIEIMPGLTVGFTAISLVLTAVFYFCFLSCHLANVRDLIVYLKTNLFVHLIFTAVNFFFICLKFETAYTYLFLPYTLGMYMGLSKFLSALYTNLIMLVFVFIIPFLQSPE